MDKFKTFLEKIDLKKNKWELLSSLDDKKEFSPELINLVQTAYASTTMGSFVNNQKDVIPSDWVVLDWDKEDDLDVLIFYRKERSNEPWKGFKIQGIGHDGQKESKKKVIQQVQKLLMKNGWWIEASDAMEAILKKSNVPVVTNETTLQRLFNDKSLRIVSDIEYERTLKDGTKIRESVFGKPKLS